ncbi:MAG: hypothetical protein WCH65_05910 [bacterium]
MFPARSVAIILICADEVSMEFTVHDNDPLLFVPVVMIAVYDHHKNPLLENSILRGFCQKFISLPVLRVMV